MTTTLNPARCYLRAALSETMEMLRQAGDMACTATAERVQRQLDDAIILEAEGRHVDAARERLHARLTLQMVAGGVT